MYVRCSVRLVLDALIHVPDIFVVCLFVVCLITRPCDEQEQYLAEAQQHLAALQSNLEDLVKKRELDTTALEVRYGTHSRQA